MAQPNPRTGPYSSGAPSARPHPGEPRTRTFISVFPGVRLGREGRAQAPGSGRVVGWVGMGDEMKESLPEPSSKNCWNLYMLSCPSCHRAGWRQESSSRCVHKDCGGRAICLRYMKRMRATRTHWPHPSHNTLRASQCLSLGMSRTGSPSARAWRQPAWCMYAALQGITRPCRVNTARFCHGLLSARHHFSQL